MRWAFLSLAGALSISGASASIDPVLKAKLHLQPRSFSYVTDGEDSAIPRPLGKRNATTPNLFSRTLHQLFPRQEAGRCGADFGSQRCAGSQCCSSYGWCGNEFEHCGVLVGCQPEFGRCGDAPPEPTPTPTPTPLPPSSSVVIPPSSTVVPPPSSSVLPPLPSGTLIPSVNGQCGNVTTCAGSTFGNCCSEYYYCGSSLNFCGTGCRPGFGTCGGVAPPPGSSSISVPIPSSSSTVAPTTTPTPTPTPTPTSTPAPIPTNVSTNGRCGADGSGMTCSGSTFGRCCSSYGWCGDDANDYCRTAWGCQPAFGTCTS